MGYCPFSSMSHDTMDCIMTQGAAACSRGPRHGWLRAKACGSARAAWLAGESRYKCCIVAGGNLWVVIQSATRPTTW